MTENTERELPERITKLRDAWYKFMTSWRVCHYILGFGGTICATAVAANPILLQGIPYVLNTMGWVSAASIGILTLLRPHGRANAYAAAWRVLNGACNRYALDTASPIEELLSAADKGEELIQASDPTG